MTTEETKTNPEFAWLIEAPGHHWLTPNDRCFKAFGWTTDATKALRFHSKVQAAAALDALRLLIPHQFTFEETLAMARPTEHAFLDAVRPSPDTKAPVPVMPEERWDPCPNDLMHLRRALVRCGLDGRESDEELTRDGVKHMRRVILQVGRFIHVPNSNPQ